MTSAGAPVSTKKTRSPFTRFNSTGAMKPPRGKRIARAILLLRLRGALDPESPKRLAITVRVAARRR